MRLAGLKKTVQSRVATLFKWVGTTFAVFLVKQNIIIIHEVYFHWRNIYSDGRKYSKIWDRKNISKIREIFFELRWDKPIFRFEEEKNIFCTQMRKYMFRLNKSILDMEELYLQIRENSLNWKKYIILLHSDGNNICLGWRIIF